MKIDVDEQVAFHKNYNGSNDLLKEIYTELHLLGSLICLENHYPEIHFRNQLGNSSNSLYQIYLS